VKRKFDLEFINESVWMEIKIRYGCNLLTGNRYFPPDTRIDFLRSYLNSFENVLCTLNFGVVLFGDLNFPNFDWEHYSSIIIIIILNRKETRSTLTRVYLGLVSVMADVGRNLLDLVFSR
jgi:hypothetical protein